MTSAKQRKANRARAAAYRARMRAQGMRLLQIWVPDTRSPEFAKEAHRQSHAVARSPHAKEDQAFVDSISILDELEPYEAPLRPTNRRIAKRAGIRPGK